MCNCIYGLTINICFGRLIYPTDVFNFVVMRCDAICFDCRTMVIPTLPNATSFKSDFKPISLWSEKCVIFMNTHFNIFILYIPHMSIDQFWMTYIKKSISLNKSFSIFSQQRKTVTIISFERNIVLIKHKLKTAGFLPPKFFDACLHPTFGKHFSRWRESII